MTPLDPTAVNAAKQTFGDALSWGADPQDALSSALSAFADALSSLPAQAVGVKPEWRCFHCDEIFTDEQSAREHFGPDQDSTPACQIKAGAERSLVRALRAAEAATADAIHGMHDESTEGYKAYYAANSRFNAAVQAAEEAGYERGMLDMRAELSAPSQPAAVGEGLNDEEKRILGNIKWESVDRDNMEFTARVSCYQLDALNKLLSALRSTP